MNKIWKIVVSIILSFAMMLAFASCKDVEVNDNEVNDNEQDYIDTQFEEPTEYFAEIIITINPKVKLFVDDDLNVLAVNYMNSDAENAYGDLNLTNIDYQSAIDSIVEKAYEKGYLSNGSTISYEVISDDENTKQYIAYSAQEISKTIVEEKNIDVDVELTDIVLSDEISAEFVQESDKISFECDCNNILTCILSDATQKYVDDNIVPTAEEIDFEKVSRVCGVDAGLGCGAYSCSFTIAQKCKISDLVVTTEKYIGSYDGSSWTITVK